MFFLFQQLVQVDSRAVQLGALFIRGLATLIMANSACGFPFSMDDFMPWKVFDGKLFQEKYQQSHRGCSLEELLEGNVSMYITFVLGEAYLSTTNILILKWMLSFVPFHSFPFFSSPFLVPSTPPLPKFLLKQN